MPWEVNRDNRCPADRPFGVVKTSTDELVACHGTRAEAEAHQATMYANVEEPAVMTRTEVEQLERADNPKPYGNVTYADPENGKYPIDTEEHARAALSYFSMPKNQAGYSPSEVSAIMGRIRAACRKFGIQMAEENSSRSRHAEIETRDADVKDVNYAQRIITVIAAPYEQPAVINYKGEAWNEMFMRTAWDGLRNKPTPGSLRANRDHNRSRTVGKVVNLFPERDEGLVTEIRIAKTQLGDETLALADEDCLSSSVGFGVLPEGQELDRASRTRKIKTAYLDHIAFVESPAYAGASVIGVRADEQSRLVEQLKCFERLMTLMRATEPEVEQHETPYLDQFTDDDVFRWASERLRRT